MQEHAEGPRSKPMQVCFHCGATLKPYESICPNCGREQTTDFIRSPKGDAGKNRK